jgi:hypothetical protein
MPLLTFTARSPQFKVVAANLPLITQSRAAKMHLCPSYWDESKLRVAFVLGTCALLALAAVLYIVSYAHNVPYYDDWSMLDVLSGAQPVDAGWLWDAHNGRHRILVPKLVLLALYDLSGWDFRSGMYANVALLAGLAWAGIRVAVKRRGHWSYTDAFFPVMLLNWGHYGNLLWSWQVTQVIPVVIVLGLLLAIVRFGTQLTGSASICCGVAVAALPLCGVNGLAYVPGFALWLVEVGRQSWWAGSRNAQRDALITWALAAVAVVLIPIYFIDLKYSVRQQFQLLLAFKTMGAFVANGLGPAAASFGPWSYALVFGVFLSAAVVLGLALQNRDTSVRSRAIAMLMFAAAFSGLAFAVGVARPGPPFSPRYFLQAVPAWWWAYFVLDVCGGAWTRRVALTSVLCLAVATSVVGFRIGLGYAKDRDDQLAAFETDLRKGMPPSQLIASHYRTLLPWPEDGGAYFHEELMADFAELKKQGIGAFKSLKSDGSFREVPLSEVARLIDSNRTSEGLTQTWMFTDESFVYGMRIAISATPDTSSTTAIIGTEVFWSKSGDARFSNDRRFLRWWLPQERYATFWVYDEVRWLRIRLDDPSGLYAAPQISLLAKK